MRGHHSCCGVYVVVVVVHALCCCGVVHNVLCLLCMPNVVVMHGCGNHGGVYNCLMGRYVYGWSVMHNGDDCLYVTVSWVCVAQDCSGVIVVIMLLFTLVLVLMQLHVSGRCGVVLCGVC